MIIYATEINLHFKEVLLESVAFCSSFFFVYSSKERQYTTAIKVDYLKSGILTYTPKCAFIIVSEI